MLIRSFFLGLYFASLLSFSLVSHPVSYCILLLTSALSVSAFCYLLLGFSWYLLLFCLVYVGGVYILFIFVSMHNPNPMPVLGSNVSQVFFLSFFLFFCFSFMSGSPAVCVEQSHYLCTMFEGVSYCFFCLILILGFMVVSFVCSEKDSFFR